MEMTVVGRQLVGTPFPLQITTVVVMIDSTSRVEGPFLPWNPKSHHVRLGDSTVFPDSPGVVHRGGQSQGLDS